MSGVVRVDPKGGHQQVAEEDGGVLVLHQVLLPDLAEDRVHGLHGGLVEPGQQPPCLPDNLLNMPLDHMELGGDWESSAGVG